MFARSLFVTLTFLLCLGCDRQTNTAPPAASDLAASANIVAAVKPVSADPESAVAAIEAVTTKVRRDSSGSIIDVDFRGLDVKDGDLVKIERGPLAGFICSVDKIVDDARVWVLIDILHQKTRAEVPLHNLLKIS